MIKNATLTNITPPAASSPTGKVTYGAGTNLSPGVRVALSPLSRGQSIAVDRRVSESDAVMYVLMNELAATGATLASRFRVTVAMDESGAAGVYEVMMATDGVKAGGLSHFECFLKRV